MAKGVAFGESDHLLLYTVPLCLYALPQRGTTEGDRASYLRFPKEYVPPMPFLPLCPSCPEGACTGMHEVNKGVKKVQRKG